MDIKKYLSTIPNEIRDHPTVQGLAILVQTLVEQLDLANAKIKSLEDELNKLRKQPKRPKFRPNGMEPRNRKGRKDEKKGDSDSNIPHVDSTLAKKEVSEIKVPAENVPKDCRFKGYQTFTVQDISLVAKEITYKLEVWQTPEGGVIRAKLPAKLQGQHFGPTLKAFTTGLYAHGVTQPAIHELLRGLGIEISTGKINDVFLDEAEKYSNVSEEILTAGLEEAPYIRSDDTGSKHKHKAGYCTHIGGEFFAYYKTTFSKSRENFLKILLQGKESYQINEHMIRHLFQFGVEDDILNLFEDYKGKSYRSKKGLNRLLNSLNIWGKQVRKQCLEAGIVGFIAESILRPGQVFLSDRAGQFALFNHSGCWVHMERPLRKISCSSEAIEKELSKVREAIWGTYKVLKKACKERQGKEEVHNLFNQLTAMKTSSETINAVIANFRAYKDELLKPLDCPGLPPHNNDSERDIRPVAKRRNISGSTKSDEGLKFRDGLQTIKQTCYRLGYNLWDYLQLWFRGQPPNLAELVRQRYRTVHP